MIGRVTVSFFFSNYQLLFFLRNRVIPLGTFLTESSCNCNRFTFFFLVTSTRLFLSLGFSQCFVAGTFVISATQNGVVRLVSCTWSCLTFRTNFGGLFAFFNECITCKRVIHVKDPRLAVVQHRLNLSYTAETPIGVD